MDESPTLIGALIGAAVIREAGRVLEHVLRATGQAIDADELKRVRDWVIMATDRMTEVSGNARVESGLRRMSRIVTDSLTVRGLRWEFYLTVRSFGPCQSLNSLVFGPGEDYRQWLEDARASLVRRESDEELFRFLGRGFFGTGVCLPLLESFQLMRDIG